MAEIWKGAPVAESLTEDLKLRAQRLKARGMQPCLAILRAGEDPAGAAYESAAVKRCEKADIKTLLFTLPAVYGFEELVAAVDRINGDAAIHGCLFLRPLENKEHERWVCENLKAEKDVDCATAASLAGVFSGEGKGYSPCTAQAVMEMLRFYGAELRGAQTAVIGRSLVVGRPLSMLLQQKDATVTMCHSRTADIEGLCRQADIVIAAAGKAEMVGPDWIKPGAAVIDVGINLRPDGNLCGDVDFEGVKEVCGSISPVPGGVGSVTTAVLAKHVIEAAEKASR